MNRDASGAKRALFGLGIALLASVIYVWNFGLWPRYFDIEWDEEVLLSDGQMIVVHVKRTFERNHRLGRWQALARDTEIAFDAGPPWGRLSRKFQRYDVKMLERRYGNWYVTLGVTTGIPPTRVVDVAYPVLIFGSNGVEHPATSWNDIPDFPRQNIMPITPSPEGVLPFANTQLKWGAKLEHWKRFPRAAGDDGIIIQRRSINQEAGK